MSKSLNNFYTVADIEKRGFDPLALRYLYLTAHYRDPLNFTWDSLAAAQSALAKIKNQISDFKDSGRTVLSEEKNRKVDEYREKFAEAIGDDLNTPQTLAVLWEMLKSNIPGEDKYDLALSFDEVLGLQLNKLPEKKQIPEEVKRLLKERESLRKEGKFAEADEIRKQIQDFGLKVSDEKIS